MIKFNKPVFYGSNLSSGFDIESIETKIIHPNTRQLIKTGLYILEGDPGVELQIRPRSGLALKKGVVAFLGTVDIDYRDEIGILLFNHGSDEFLVTEGMRIAQGCISPVFRLESSKLAEVRIGGWGSTNKENK